MYQSEWENQAAFDAGQLAYDNACEPDYEDEEEEEDDDFYIPDEPELDMNAECAW